MLKTQQNQIRCRHPLSVSSDFVRFRNMIQLGLEVAKRRITVITGDAFTEAYKAYLVMYDAFLPMWRVRGIATHLNLHFSILIWRVPRCQNIGAIEADFRRHFSRSIQKECREHIVT